ncbi:MAG: DNA-binding domain-containing protein [Sedimentisphaerales bacterium]
MLTVTEAANRLGYCIGRVQQLAAQNKLPGAFKRNGDWQIPADSHPNLISDSSLVARNSEELKDIAAPKRDEAIKRLGIIAECEKFAAAYKREGKNRLDAIIDFATQKQIPVRTLHRWISLYKEQGILGLVDKRGRPNVNDVISPDAWEYFKSLYLTKQKQTVKMCWQTVSFINRDQQKNWKIPSLNVMYRFVDKAIPAYVQTLLREGMAAYEAKFAPYIITDPDSIAPGQIWVGDHAEFNCWIRYRNQWVRPWVTAWMDMRSRALVGWHISTSPNQTTILLAAKNAVDKYGLPDSVKIDNGRDYDSQMWTGQTKKQRRALGRGYLDEQWLAGLWGYMNVAVSFAIPYHPQSKGILERWFDTVDNQFTKTIATYAGKYADDKPDDLRETLSDPGTIVGAYTLDSFEQVFAKYVETYNHSLHTGWGMEDRTPMQIFNTRTSRRIMQEGVSDLLMRVWSPELIVGKNGVQFKGLYFGQYDMELAAHKGQKVRCCYDPADMSRIYVYDSATLRLITIAEQARLVQYGAGVAEEDLREASTEKRRAVNIAKQFRDKSLTATMDLTDLAIRARRASQEFSSEKLQTTVRSALRSEINPTQAAIRPVITPLNNQVSEHKRLEVLKHVRRAAGAESVETVLDIDFSSLKSKEDTTEINFDFSKLKNGR